MLLAEIRQRWPFYMAMYADSSAGVGRQPDGNIESIGKQRGRVGVVVAGTGELVDTKDAAVRSDRPKAVPVRGLPKCGIDADLDECERIFVGDRIVARHRGGALGGYLRRWRCNLQINGKQAELQPIPHAKPSDACTVSKRCAAPVAEIWVRREVTARGAGDMSHSEQSGRVRSPRAGGQQRLEAEGRAVEGACRKASAATREYGGWGRDGGVRHLPAW